MDKMVLDDASVVAFLSLKKLKITPQLKPDGKVNFLVEGDNITEALQELYGNVSVGALDYIKAFKGFRSSIFAMKRERDDK
ncbi:MAG: hypothetical protein A4E59_02607 [Syntrophorhabdus sp. PtaB.Bin027]|jgi:hypothetical protein|nr:MAG: hypothetical protein A4E59_02607 [Syntrophorhabdus sp. PtaB.Bin027]OQB77651.1 MAG: hypothetical protein BWX92_00748 [Deltaproteobacteria bacterium ADurb.Bin135]